MNMPEGFRCKAMDMKGLDYTGLRRLIFIFCLFTLAGCFSTSSGQSKVLSDIRYAIVIKQNTYNIARWKQVCDTLSSYYKGHLFIWNTSLSEVKEPVISYSPTHICFVCDIGTGSPSFIINSLYPFTRTLDDDPYTDAIWGVLTEYAEDAYRIAADTVTHYTKTLLSGTVSSDLSYFTQGFSTHEATSGLFYVKQPNSTLIRSYTTGPTDRTSWLVSMINGGIDSLDHAPVDIFITSGHGNYNLWQLHYPTQSPEGLFRSGTGVLTGVSASGEFYPISSSNPKIYFGLGNCNIGQLINDGEPGNNGKWGNRHPAVILPFTATDINILSTDAITALVKENFVLLNIWHTGLDALKKGDTREVIFTCNRLATGTDFPDAEDEGTDLIDEIYPNPASPKITISYRISGNTRVIIRLFDINGTQVDMIDHVCRAPGLYSEDFVVTDLANGVYYCLIVTSETHESVRFVVTK